MERFLWRKLKQSRPLTKTEQLILDYVRRSKKSRETVWMSEAMEELGIDPREAVRGAKFLEEQGPLRSRHLA